MAFSPICCSVTTLLEIPDTVATVSSTSLLFYRIVLAGMWIFYIFHIDYFPAFYLLLELIFVTVFN